MKKSIIIIVLLGWVVFPSRAQLICFEFPPDTFSTPPVPISVTAADLNGDSFDDLIICQNNGEIFSILNDGAGKFLYVQPIPLSSPALKILAVKINNDDIMDLVVIGYYTYIFMGYGDGTFYQSSVVDVGDYSCDGVAGYFNQDDFIDLALINGNSTLSILFGEYTGTFNEVHVYYTMGRSPRNMADGDFNEDGIIDLVVCNYGLPNGSETGLVMFKGTSLGSFLPVVISQENYPQSAAVGDFNMDSHQDIIFKRYDRWLYKLWGNGDGTFQEPVIEDISAIYYAVYLHEIDIDSDSIPDLAMGNHYFNMHINDGFGNFADTLFINEKSNSRRVGDITTGNFNGDSKPDIVSTHIEDPDSEYGSIAVYLNCLPVSVAESNLVHEEIELYPNPGNGHLKISADPSLECLEIAGIYDCHGLVIDKGLYSKSGQYLDLSSLKAGLYIIQFTNGYKSISRKIIIN